MIRFLRKLWKDRRGNALVIIGLALPLLIGSAGLATDSIQWVLWHRQLQRAADSAALAGVRGMIAGQTPVASCTSGSVNRDLTLNNHVLLGNGNTACTAANPVNWSGSGNDANAVKVTLAVRQKLGFSSLFLSTAPTISASATASVITEGKYCVVSLDNTNTTGLTYQGNANIDMGCGMKTNSRGTCATDAGGSATVHASPMAAVGGICNSQGVFDSSTVMQPYSAPQADPYASINPPDSTTFPTQNCPNFKVNSNTTVSSLTVNTDYRSSSSWPSNYYCMGDMSLDGTVNLPSGVYVIDGGNFSVGSQAVVNCTSCTFILTNRSTSSTATIGSVGMNGGATINMTDSQSGTYAGMLFYQDRRATLTNGGGQSNQINGNASSSFQGAFYFPSTQVTFNGTSGMQTNCMQLVGWQVTFSGNTSISNTCPSGGPETTFDATTVRLVA